MTLLYNIRQICKMNGIKLSTLEEMAGLGANTIFNWDKSIPSADKVLKVAQNLDVSVDYLLGNSENPYSHKTEPVYDTAGFVASLEEIRSVVEQKIAETKQKGKNAESVEAEISNQ